MSKSQSNNPESWKQYFSDLGLPEVLIDEYVSYVTILRKSNVPVIFELEHLSQLLDLNRVDLAKIINSPVSYYREFKIPKRNGSKRLIHAPYPSLLNCQDWIYRNILKRARVHFRSFGFTPGRSFISNAEPHLACKHLLKMDVKDFFPSIPFNWVMQFFLDLGYAQNVAFYLSSICCVNGGLSQGAPTSPMLSNTLLYNLDKRLYTLSKKYHLVYTRYADDLNFSGTHIPLAFSTIVEQVITDYGLIVNDEKTKLIRGAGKKIVTGVSVSGQSARLPREYKRQLKQEIYYIKRYGLISHMSKSKIKDPGYVHSLLGKLSYWLQVEPRNEFAIDAIDFIKKGI